MKKTIMLDMDEVIVVDLFKNMVEKFLGEQFNPELANTFYLQDVLGDRKKEFFQFFVTQNIYDYGCINKDAKKYLEKIAKVYDVYVTTDYIWRDIPEFSGEVLKQKFNFLRKEFPFLDYRKFIFTSEKSVIKCDIRIDDRVENLINNNSTKYLFTAYHNKMLAKQELDQLGIQRINNWQELADLLLADLKAQ